MKHDQSLFAIALAFACAVGNASAQAPSVPPKKDAAATMKKAPPCSAPATLAEYRAIEETERKNLENFDDIDFNVYSNQKWDELPRSHAQDIVVHYPDGSTTKGLSDHIEQLKPMFVFAPDTKIKQHPIKIAQGDKTAVAGVIEGTFTKPMPIGNGKFIQPTNKPFKLNMLTVGIWKDGVMTEEYLYWDNQALMKQIGAQ